MRRCARRSCPTLRSCPFSFRCLCGKRARTETSTCSHPSLAGSPGPGSCGTCSRSTSRRARDAAARPAGSRLQPSPRPLRGCSRSTVTARGRHRQGRRREGSCGSRFQARERGERRAKARSVRAARAELRPRGRETEAERAVHGPSGRRQAWAGRLCLMPRRPGADAAAGSGRPASAFPGSKSHTWPVVAWRVSCSGIAEFVPVLRRLHGRA